MSCISKIEVNVQSANLEKNETLYPTLNNRVFVSMMGVT